MKSLLVGLTVAMVAAVGCGKSSNLASVEEQGEHFVEVPAQKSGGYYQNGYYYPYQQAPTYKSYGPHYSKHSYNPGYYHHKGQYYYYPSYPTYPGYYYAPVKKHEGAPEGYVPNPGYDAVRRYAPPHVWNKVPQYIPAKKHKVIDENGNEYWEEVYEGQGAGAGAGAGSSEGNYWRQRYSGGH